MFVFVCLLASALPLCACALEEKVSPGIVPNRARFSISKILFACLFLFVYLLRPCAFVLALLRRRPLQVLSQTGLGFLLAQFDGDAMIYSVYYTR